jgi:protein-tyrosine phosphatase
MAEALLRRRLLDVGELPRVHSAGLRADGLDVSRGAVAALAPHGLDIGAHRSRLMTQEMLAEADLVVGMAREHVREAVVLHPDAWPRTFTLKELVRRGEQAGARSPGQSFEEWLEKVHAGRTRMDLLDAALDDDVADPIGMSNEFYERTAAEIGGLVDRLVALGWGNARTKERDA